MAKEIPQEELDDYFPADEGSANLYYGLIRSGKTYGATADIHEELRQGHTVYATWPIATKDFDDRQSVLFILRGLFLPWKKRYFYIPTSKNFHYINAETGEVDGIKTFDPTSPQAYINFLNTLNHCSLYIDEAWRVIDSYKGVNFSVESRNLILVTGHKFRTVNLIAQRPTSIHVTARGNMNRFYRFEKLGSIFGFVRFLRTEFQVMTGENVDEESEPISVKTYWGKRWIFESYNSYYYGELDTLHPPTFYAWDLDYVERLRLLGSKVLRALAPSVSHFTPLARVLTRVRGGRASGRGGESPWGHMLATREARGKQEKAIHFKEMDTLGETPRRYVGLGGSGSGAVQ